MNESTLPAEPQRSVRRLAGTSPAQTRLREGPSRCLSQAYIQAAPCDRPRLSMLATPRLWFAAV